MHMAIKLPILAALLLSAALFVRGPVSTAHAYPGSDGLTVAGACNPDGTLSILIRWTAYSTGPQYLDLSLYNNGFAPGTFVGFGPVAPNVDFVQWTGILNSTTYYLRMNTQTPTAWYPSETIRFSTTPCPVLSPVPVVIPAPVFVPFPIVPVLPAPPPILIPGPPGATTPPGQTTPPGTAAPLPPPGPSQLPY
jgi:hypothetical protein